MEKEAQTKGRIKVHLALATEKLWQLCHGLMESILNKPSRTGKDFDRRSVSSMLLVDEGWPWAVSNRLSFGTEKTGNCGILNLENNISMREGINQGRGLQGSILKAWRLMEIY
jgi:hypothetical protein